MLNRAIPTEVLDNILSRISDDKHTLAQCMRVSPTFNALAAPLLYRSMNIDNTVKFFFAAPRQSEEFAKTRKTADKAFKLGYVKELEYKTHKKSECTPLAQLKKWDRLLLRVPILQINYRASGEPCTLCDCLQFISPRKLVYKRDGLVDYMIQFISDDAHRETTVSIMPLLSHWFEAHISLLYNSPALRLSQSIFICPANLNPTGYEDRHWESIRDDLFHAVQKTGTPNSIILVNIENLFDERLEAGEYKDMTAAEAATLDTQTAYLESPHLVNSPYRRRRWKSEEEARQVTFKFVSMETYLAEYNWEGDFTEEEVRPWMTREEWIEKRGSGR